ncbi:MAG: hypothetical protein O3B84_06950, partial [Chloroflexi bacterium]|nr:hypothetical protein [Chloroflexota bacterium]
QEFPQDTRISQAYAASIVGGCIAAQSLLRVDEKVASLWDETNWSHVQGLLETWSSTIALYLLRQQSAVDQATVVDGIARTFADWFESDQETAIRRLNQYNTQIDADDKLWRDGGVPTYGNTLLRLRCLAALGLDIDLDQIAVPIHRIEGLLESGIVSYEWLGSIEEMIVVQVLLASSAKEAREVFDRAQ